MRRAMDWAAEYHEAGHAIIASYFDMSLSRIQMTPNSGTIFYQPTDDEAVEACFFAAGYAAETLRWRLSLAQKSNLIKNYCAKDFESFKKRFNREINDNDIRIAKQILRKQMGLLHVVAARLKSQRFMSGTELLRRYEHFNKA